MFFVKRNMCLDISYNFYIQLRKKINSCVFLPVVFVGEGVEMFLFLMYDVLQAFIDRCTAVTNLLQHSLKNDHIANHRILQYVNLQDTEIVKMFKEMNNWSAQLNKDHRITIIILINTLIL